MQELKSTRHSKYNINYHLVWIPKYRYSVLQGEVASRLKDIIHIIAKKKELEILALEIQPNHVHCFISSPPKNSPSLLVNWLKGISARMYNHRYKPKIKWTKAYYVGTAGHVSAETIKRYIDEQSKKNHKS